ncbi:glycoside hydrolase family 9 protein [Pseudoxanthomonas daejeonensis]|uniref:glycoside hydrolase family 9 protein n=1 Tax=Pseudoxanthomonas daejeonensis TaxID=266062 RepID=UPI001F543B1E|nr:glycoside hydrolase family 9 protein [Pseudoxanthomonas daejeonensis]UNK57758.1 glycoside hydrolase family 9 protein [Pseudoxanthomonas daejeonensis]
MKHATLVAAGLLVIAGNVQGQAQLKLNEQGYFEAPGLNVTVFADIYPDGHQTGVTVIQHGERVAANGDLRLEPSPGQWSPMPAGDGKPVVDVATGTVTQALRYPDESKNRKGFNPIVYPDLAFGYRVSVTPMEGYAFKVSVDLDKPLPADWEGKVGFNFELFPTDLFGKSWLLDDASGIFPRQANGPVQDVHGQLIATPMASGRTLVVAPESDLQRLKIHSRTGRLELLDGRGTMNNGWYVVREITRPGATKEAVSWIVTPHVDPDWRYAPVVQVSQVGYRPGQAKTVVIEQDKRDGRADPLTLYRMTESGARQVARYEPKPWGRFLRYQYLTADLDAVTEPGMYELEYRGRRTHAFRIADDVYDRGVWQPTLEYFLPAQMCHMRVTENYRTWHGLDHQDDARMAQVGVHFDGYDQGPDMLSRYRPGDRVPGLTSGGWHDAGDYDLRVESQMGTVWLLAKMVEEFGLDYDTTTIDQARKEARLLRPDGVNDALQQIEHGLLSVLGGYRALGRTYRGIIEPTLEQYVLLGEVATQTDNLDYDPALAPGARTATSSSVPDDRWVFTEDNPDRELATAAGLATAARVLRQHNPQMAAEALAAAVDLTARAIDRGTKVDAQVFALSELARSTGDAAYVARLVAMKPRIVAAIDKTGPLLAEALPLVKDAAFLREVDAAVQAHQAKLAEAATHTPYGVPYVPHIWGAGWDIQKFGVDQYFFRKAWPQHTPDTLQMQALNFVLGVHPGNRTESFASGVGANSAVVAYGTNRGDWSYIPGGVISGTALIRPDLPELKVWPYFWQQREYVIGGGAENFMFLALAAAQRGSLLKRPTSAPGR